MKKIFFVFTLLFISNQWTAAQTFNPSDIKKHVDLLASDAFEGRGTATLGEIKTANYLADQFKNLGLKPAGTNGTYFQPFQVIMGIDGFAHQMTARNVIGFLDNGAEKTIVIGGHYDHLGKGYQTGSLSPDSKNLIHNGADDNASGTTGVIELAKYFAGNAVKEKHNLLFIGFSGEELGLLGSKYYTESPTIPLKSISAMINMDMIGRYNTDKGLIISGWGTSAAWGKIIPDLARKQNMKYTIDSSGVGASDHTSFYLKDIPVLQFFTGTHSDYHKTSDDSDKINAEGEADILKLIAGVLEKLDNKKEDPGFLTAGNPHAGATTSNFKVTLGVMPDYSFSGKGLKIDAVSKARPAEIAGIQAGDVITKLGGKTINTIYDYMEVLGAHEKGQQVEAEFLRGTERKVVKVIF
ncbi:M20/M25/M40 family metallo-hydrolase [Dyadobacter sp. CY356]|uniref:M20/M25/M40 family metallo-hydrolase n=1 Tax=Dyadobacter sp. CY356 TaxID=2906442 RepID=UPI001F404A62|nr:M20/M25/M40 family metallo-hydrolase [Dyadobacter sp. CY356]MCF0057211.1 M20/M25/M40 family metallo-hydrolase [Dyadobacter sp. CY356]